MSNVKLISITQDCEKIISYCARVSNPSNQENYDSAPKLLAYLIKHKHWSPFELGHMTLEIKTTRGIAAQILRHRSFTFQEYSQRYAEAFGFELCEARRQDLKNRQNSVDDFPQSVKDWFTEAQKKVWDQSYALYKEGLEKGIAKECLRFLLPLNTSTTMYMSGSIRSWIHFIELRSANGTQLEHQQIALEAKQIFCEQLPNVAKALGWM